MLVEYHFFSHFQVQLCCCRKNVTIAEKYPFHHGALQKEGKDITDASSAGNSSLDDPLMNAASFKNLT